MICGNMNRIKNKNSFIIGIICLYVVFMCFTTLGSSIFVNMMGKDSSVFYTIGRSMKSGLIPYRDLFDHKGLYIYFINYIGSLISDNYHIGLFLVETLFLIFCAYIIFKTISILDSNKWIILMTTVFVIGVIIQPFYWEAGNLVETYGLLFQLISFGILVYDFYTDKEKEYPAPHMLIHGICVSVVFFLRANLILAWVPVAITIIIVEIIKKRAFNLLQNIISGLIGLFIGAVIPLTYCLRNNCMDDMIKDSFLFNITYTTNNVGILTSFANLFTSIEFTIIILVGILSCFLVITDKNTIIYGKIIFVVSFIFSLISVVLSGRSYGHYYIYLMPFIIPSIFFLFRFIFYRVDKNILRILICIFIFGILMVNTVSIKRCVKSLFSIPVSQEFNNKLAVADYYKKNYNFLDNIFIPNNDTWFYNEFRDIPDTKYFYLPAVEYKVFPDAVDEQSNIICNKKAEVIIINWLDKEKKQVLREGINNDEIMKSLDSNYTLVYNEGNIDMFVRNDCVK